MAKKYIHHLKKNTPYLLERLKKMAPYLLLHRYQITKVLRGDWPYYLVPKTELNWKVRVYPDDKLEKNMNVLVNEDMIYFNVRSSIRFCQPPSRLQVDPTLERYNSDQEKYWDDLEDKEEKY